MLPVGLPSLRVSRTHAAVARRTFAELDGEHIASRAMTIHQVGLA
jgi:hypothetical protein